MGHSLKELEVARRYAGAVLACFDEGSDLGRARESAVVVERGVAADEIVQFLTASPIPLEARLAFLARLLEKVGAPEPFSGLVRVLGSYGRLGLLGRVMHAFQERADEVMGIVDVWVVSSHVMSTQQAASLSNMLGGALHKEVRMHYDVDPALLCGFVVRVRHVVIDYSFAGKMALLRTYLIRAS